LDTIAVGTDGTATSGRALDVAIDLAKRCEARLVVISAYRPVTDRAGADAPAEHQWTFSPTAEVDEILEKAARRAQKHGLKVTTVASDGNAADVLCKFAADQGADLLVIGNKGMQRRILGSVPNTVAHKADCSVLIVKTT
jgi:nucleotide-binding universal stress UspA family protein